MLRRSFHFVLTLLVAAFLAFGCRNTHADANKKPTVGAKQEHADEGTLIRFVKNPDPAPALEINDLSGKPILLDEDKGKIVLLNFWATWCGPCRAEIPDLIEIQKRYGDSLQIIGLDVDDDDVAEVKKFVEKNGINYPVGMATNEIRIQYGGVAALPTSFVLDKEGRVVQKHEGLRNP